MSTFSIACTETWHDRNGQKQEKTEWVRCVLWGKQAESLQEYLTKGKQVLVMGRLQTRKWEDKAGVTKYSTEVKTDRVTLLGGGVRGARRETACDEDLPGAGEQAQEDSAAGEAMDPITDDQIPF